MDDMPGMEGMAPPMQMNNTGSDHMQSDNMMTMMHMTFFWSKNAEILFSGWPGTRTGMYVLALIFVFVLAIFVEWLSHSRLIKDNYSNVTAGLVQTLMHGIRIGLAYLVMLAVMSFNIGVFIVAVAGHNIGFMLFGSRLCRKSASDLPPLSC